LAEELYLNNQDGGLTRYDVKNFTIRDITECGRIVRTLGLGASSTEEVASKIVSYLHDSLIIGQTGDFACPLVRFFKTQAFGDLKHEQQVFAQNMLGGKAPSPEIKCLTLFGTVGENQNWNTIVTSKGHQAIPLPSEEVVRQLPMIRNLIKQLGMSVNSVLNPDPELLLDMEQKTFGVFFVPKALGSPYIPAQQEFVIPYGIKSVMGFGGMLPSANIFVIIMFLKVSISKETADLFKNLSLNIKLALLPFE
jgi:hypothetical protein